MRKHLQEAIRQGKIWTGYLVLLLGLLMLARIFQSALFGKLDDGTRIWMEITLLLLIALVAERIVQTMRQPFAMVLLLLGVMISPYTIEALWPSLAGALGPALAMTGIQLDVAHPPNLVGESQMIRILANLGAIILLFRIGLHSRLEAVFNFRNLAVAIGGVVLPFLLGFGYAQSTGGNFAYSLFVGAALTATSVGITAAVLEEMGVLGRPFAQTILGAAVIDDILALLVLALIKSIPTEWTGPALAPFAQVLAVALVFVISGLALGRRFVQQFFGQKEKDLSKRTLAGLLAVLFFYSFAAESLGLSAIVGAFLAGLVISYSPVAERLGRTLFSLDVLFTPIFFIFLGMMVNVWAIPFIGVPMLILTLAAVVGKVVGCGLPARMLGMSTPDSLKVGFGMVPRGEIALIIALLGLTTLDAAGNAILNAGQYTLIASMAFLTTAIVPAGLKALLEQRPDKSA